MIPGSILQMRKMVFKERFHNLTKGKQIVRKCPHSLHCHCALLIEYLWPIVMPLNSFIFKQDYATNLVRFLILRICYTQTLEHERKESRMLIAMGTESWQKSRPPPPNRKSKAPKNSKSITVWWYGTILWQGTQHFAMLS